MSSCKSIKCKRIEWIIKCAHCTDGKWWRRRRWKRAHRNNSNTSVVQMLNAFMSMHRKYPIAVDRLQNEIRDLARIFVGKLKGPEKKWKDENRRNVRILHTRMEYCTYWALPLQRIYIDLSQLERREKTFRQGIFLFSRNELAHECIRRMNVCVCEIDHQKAFGIV